MASFGRGPVGRTLGALGRTSASFGQFWPMAHGRPRGGVPSVLPLATESPIGSPKEEPGDEGAEKSFQKYINYIAEEVEGCIMPSMHVTTYRRIFFEMKTGNFYLLHVTFLLSDSSLCGADHRCQ